MFIRRLRLPLVAAALLAGSMLAASPASAAPANCSVLDLTPKTITVGPIQKADVVFEVDTDCPEGSAVNWYLTFDKKGATQPYTGPILTNVPSATPGRAIYAPGGAYTWNTAVYGEGRYNVTINAFLGAAADDVDLPRVTLPVSVVQK